MYMSEATKKDLMEKMLQELKEQHPNWTEEEIVCELTKFVDRILKLKSRRWKQVESIEILIFEKVVRGINNSHFFVLFDSSRSFYIL